LTEISRHGRIRISNEPLISIGASIRFWTVRLLVMLLVLAINPACTTQRIIEITPEQLQKQIASGQLIKKGDLVKITTTDNTVYEFEVSEVSQDAIMGENTSVPIHLLSSLELRRKVGSDGEGMGALGLMLLFVISVSNPVAGGFAPVP